METTLWTEFFRFVASLSRQSRWLSVQTLSVIDDITIVNFTKTAARAKAVGEGFIQGQLNCLLTPLPCCGF